MGDFRIALEVNMTAATERAFWAVEPCIVQNASGFLARLENPAPGVVTTVVSGIGAFHDETVEFLDAALARRQAPLTVFHDWSELEGYPPEGRKVLVAWWKKNQEKVDRVHCCFRSKIVAMGVTVAAMLFSNLEVHRTKQDLMKARDAQIANARRRLAAGP